MAKRIPTPKHGLSLQWLYAEARYVDWTAWREREENEPVLPPPTYGDWADRDSGDLGAIDRIAKRFPNRELSDDHADDFTGTEAYDEWRDSFEPVMNFAWPVTLAYEVSVDDAVSLIARHAPACTLIDLSEDAQEQLFGGGSDSPDYVIALTGGGMNLSDHIAAAYLACGCVPPTTILTGLSGVIRDEKARTMPLRTAYRDAARAYRSRAKRLTDESRRVFAKRA